MMKVQVDLLGGLGNQLFGGALALALVGKYQDLEVTLTDRLIPLGSNSSRRLQIDGLGLFTHRNIAFKRISNARAKLLSSSSLFSRIWWKATRVSTRHHLINQEEIWNGNLQRANNFIFSDYFNDWAFIEMAITSIELPKYPIVQSKNELVSGISRLIQDSKTLTIHCRLGDYLDYPEIYPLLPASYYESSIEKVNAEINGVENIVVFCESREQLEIFYPSLAKVASRVIEKGRGISDPDSFSLMCRASNVISAHSTFSYWAAWFSRRNGGNTILPVRNIETATKDGSIYLHDSLFDMEMSKFHSGRLEEKQIWVDIKMREFAKFNIVFGPDYLDRG